MSELSFPLTTPSYATVISFWRKIAQISTRTHNQSGAWIGSAEVLSWNADNREPCQHCSTSRTGKTCVIEDDYASCRPCRTARINCDRKIKFLFDSTKEDYFPNFELFLHVYNTGKPGAVEQRKMQKAINKKFYKAVKRTERTVGARRARTEYTFITYQAPQLAINQRDCNATS
ncbi:hypothetical protein C8R45DRAFT_9265 [Mycena sanguinolenta]|nr:hypothetical protein C8R45DRAFT_9265 [Mycena sanguinolenta]